MNRNIEELRKHYMGDPSVETTLSANSLRLKGIDGSQYTLKVETREYIQKATKEMEDFARELDKATNIKVDNNTANISLLDEALKEIDESTDTQVSNKVERNWHVEPIPPHGPGMALLNEYVKKDGDTMTGNLIIENNTIEKRLPISVVEGKDDLVIGYNNKVNSWFSIIAGAVMNVFGNFNYSFGNNNTIGSETTPAYSNFVVGASNVIKTSRCYALGHFLELDRYIQTVIGQANLNKINLFTVGNGQVTTSEVIRSDALTLDRQGNLTIQGTLHSNGADYGETTEWLDGNENAEDRTGMFVCMQGTKMRLATSQDKKQRIGVVSAFPAINGDSFENEWHSRFVTDVFGRKLLKEVEVTDENGVVSNELQYVLNPNYDETLEYIPRNKRKEFDVFSFIGKVVVIDDGTCVEDGYCYPNDNGIATATEDGFYVMERIDDTHIRVLLK